MTKRDAKVMLRMLDNVEANAAWVDRVKSAPGKPWHDHQWASDFAVIADGIDDLRNADESELAKLRAHLERVAESAGEP